MFSQPQMILTFAQKSQGNKKTNQKDDLEKIFTQFPCLNGDTIPLQIRLKEKVKIMRHLWYAQERRKSFPFHRRNSKQFLFFSTVQFKNIFQDSVESTLVQPAAL